MRQFIAIAFTLGILPWAAIPTHAQVSESDARRMGMETAWKSQVQLPRVGTGLISSHLWVEKSNSRKFAVVELGERSIRVAASQSDRKGNPIGIEAAKKLASEQAVRLLGKTTGFQVVEVDVPQIKLMLVSSDGLVQAIDAESGKLLWSTPCGESSAPAHPAATSAVGLSLIHGESLYLLDWETGKRRMTKPLRFATSNAIAVCNNIAFVSDFAGRIESYGLGADFKPWGYVISGRAIGKPVNLADGSFCAIATDTGFVYVFAGGEQPNVWIRFESNSQITGSLAAGNGAFYVGTTGGVVSKVSLDDRFGLIKWEYHIGQTVTAAPLIVGDTVIATNEEGDVVSINDASGLANWVTPGLAITDALGRSGNRIFCRTSSNELIALDKQTGSVIGKSEPISMSRPIINQINDRIYLVSQNGQLQCLRPIGADLPTMLVPIVLVEEAAAESNSETPPAATGNDPFNMDVKPATGADPFSSGGDPFGIGAAGAGGTGADPFGGAGGTDPFGSNPFGGGN